jgi:hypothetical protein
VTADNRGGDEGVATNAPHVDERKKRAARAARGRRSRPPTNRKYRRPIERVKRPAETTTLGAGILAAVVSGLGLDGAGVDTTTWLTAAVGIVPFLVSACVDFLRERKEERELRADLSGRAVMALEALARIDLPVEELTGEEDQAFGTDELSDHDLSDLFLGKTKGARSSSRGKEDGEPLAGATERPATGTRGTSRSPAPRKQPPRSS